MSGLWPMTSADWFEKSIRWPRGREASQPRPSQDSEKSRSTLLFTFAFYVSPFVFPLISLGWLRGFRQVVSDHPNLSPFHPTKWANLNIGAPLLAKHITWTADRVGPCGSSRHLACRPWFVRILQLACFLITDKVGVLTRSHCLFYRI